jgi:hypothetical protein
VIRERAAAALAKFKTLGAAAKIKLKERARWAWRHRTKTVGGLGVGVGALEHWLEAHQGIHLPGRGYLLMGFGAIVTAIGGYNTLASIFGWEDDPT